MVCVGNGNVACIMIAVPLTLLIVAIVISICCKLIPSSTQLAVQETVFVCMVGNDIARLRAHAIETIGNASRYTSVTVGIIVLVDSASEIAVSNDADPAITVRWVLRKQHSSLPMLRQLAIDELYRGEQYVLFLYGAVPSVNWNENSMQLVDNDHCVLLALASDVSGSERAAFPVLDVSDNVVRVRKHDFAIHRNTHVPTCVWTHQYVFMTANCLFTHRKCMFHESCMTQTHELAVKNVQLRLAAIPLYRPTSRMGVELRRSNVALDHACHGSHPGVGIVDRANSEELILKYGNIDVAIAEIEQSSASTHTRPNADHLQP